MSSPLWRIKRLRRPPSGDVAGNHPETIAEQQEGEIWSGMRHGMSLG